MTHTLPARPDTAAASVGSGRREVGVLIVGSGFAGLGAAIRLAQQGREDFLVLERASEVGGTWRDNTYPGAACDVPSHLYSYSFALNPNWSRSFSPQGEIQKYLRQTARDAGVLDKHRFDTEMLQATWDEASQRWLVDTTNGNFSTKVLVPAVGALAEPSLPDIPGADSFRGHVMHTARWDHSVDLRGKRVALIGTGASAIQAGPKLAEQVGHLTVFQRTAPWVMPRHDRTYPAVESFAYQHVPGLQRLAREAIYWGRESYMLGFSGLTPALLMAAQQIAKHNIDKAIKDKALRAAVTPDWRIGCKRILISNDWYPMLARDNVSLETGGIAEIRSDSIVTSDGTVHEVDAIVFATGFHVTDSPMFWRMTGVDGRSLGQVWDTEGQQAYKGAAVAGFPNMLLIVGPNCGLGHSSMIFMIESHINYLLSALDTMDDQGITRFEIRRAAQQRFNDDLQQRMKRTIWSTGGCSSWYLDKHGRNTTLWPGFTFEFRLATRRFDVAAYTTSRTSERTTA
ncbi:MAG: flavin-containing monooxygenase [Jatrophihabitans sp.]|uniref:flavin-containing monooxygenase n=1 Tax=Jatrophihabitans sp. TaxID=1932789 RepID=UPI003F7D1356